MVTLHKDSHLDHSISSAQMEWILAQCQDRDGFFILTLTLPEELGTVPCGLYGPVMGDRPIPEVQVYYAKRGNRTYNSRMLAGTVRQVREVSVIAGPHDGLSCVLYTVFGGPVSPQEPNDPTCKDRAKSEAFWKEHALAL